MAKIIVASKQDLTVLQDTLNNKVVLKQPSIVQIAISKDDVASISRSGNNAVITLKNGEKIIIEGFYQGEAETVNNLVFQDAQGQTVVAELDAKGQLIRYNPIEQVADLVQSSTGVVQAQPTEISQVEIEEDGINWKSVMKTGAMLVAGEALYLWAFDNDDKSSKANPDIVAPETPTASLDADGKVLSGKAEAGSTVIVKDITGSILGQVQVGQDGTFKLELKTPVTDGNRVLVYAKDAAGNESKLLGVTGSKDTIAPEAANAQVNTTGTIVSGKAEAGSKVYVYAADNTTILGGPVTVAKDGSFSVSLNQALKNGETGSVIVEDAAGNKSQSTVIEVGKDTLAPEQPKVSVSGKGDLITGTGEAGAKISVTNAAGKVIASGVVDAKGQFSLSISPALTEKETAKITLTDAAGNSSKALEVMANTDTIAPTVPTATLSDDALTISGQAEAGAKIAVLSNKDGSTLGTATVNADGTYSVKLNTALTDNNSVKVYVTDSSGNTSEGKLVVGYKDTVAPSAPSVPTVTDDSTADKKVIKAGETTADSTPVFEGTGEKGAIITIYDNGVAIATVTVDNTVSAKWSYTPAEALADGPHSFTFTQMDAAKNISTMSEAFNFTVQTAAPKMAMLSAFAEQDDLSDVLSVVDTAHTSSAAQLLNSTSSIAGGAVDVNALLQDSSTHTANQINLNVVTSETATVASPEMIKAVQVSAEYYTAPVSINPLDNALDPSILYG